MDGALVDLYASLRIIQSGDISPAALHYRLVM